jgi:demethylmenaquinone methyltransferase/2-methoxy-6-polyprenyl-1,4-benzoquinol methylase
MDQTKNPTPRPGLDEFAYFGYQPVAPAEKEKLVHGHFDTVSSRYDFMNTLLSFGMHYPWKWTAVRLLKLQAGDRVLDVCGGTADLALLAAKKIGPAGRVVVYDINRAMMAAGYPKVARAGLTSRIAFIQGDAEHLSCPDASFDAAMVGFGIRNLTHPELGFKEMHRVLKPGGRLMCLEFSQPVTTWFRRLYDFYSFYIMPLMGRIFVGSWQAYTYLPESIRMFANPEDVSATLAGLGYKDIRYRRLTNGIAVIHLAVKP